MASSSNRNLELWNEYKKTFNKSYEDAEEDKKRMELFLESKRVVEEHNEKFKRGESTYEMGINQFSDWFPEERKRLGGLRLPVPEEENKECEQ